MPESEVEQLRREVAELRGQVGAERQQRRARTRRIVSWIMAVLAILALTLSLTGIWTWRTLTNTDLFVERVGPIIEQPEVVAEVSTRVSTAIVDGLGLQERVAEALPEQAAILAAPITAAARSFVQDSTEALVTSDQFRAAWDTALAASHTIAIRVLEGDDEGALTLTDGAVTINLVPLINQVLVATEGFLAGLFNREIDLPTVTEDQLDEAITAIENQFDVQLPADFGQVTLFAADDLATAQNAYQAASVAIWIAPIAALILAALAIAISTRRLRMALSIVVGTALALLFVGLALAPAEDALVGAVSDKGLAGAVGSAFETLFSTLIDGIYIILIVGVAAALALFFSGRSRPAEATRAAAKQVPAQAGRYRTFFVVGGVVAAVILLAVIPGRSFGQFALVMLMLAAYLLAVFLAPSPPEADSVETGAQPAES
jgi:hypothetical protein